MKAVQLFQMRRRYRNLGRLRDIINVFVKHGLGQVIEALQLTDIPPIRWWYKPLHTRLDRDEVVSAPERLRMALEELGPTFIKFGQLLSTRTDLVPREYVAALDSLLDQVPPFPGDQARRIIEHDLKRPLSEAVARFDDVPIAAASIAQVHRAMLWTGEEVVFKVRRPGIREMVRHDVAILRRVAQLIDRYAPDIGFVNAVSLVEEFNQAIHEEMDFLREAENVIRIRDNFQRSPNVYIPQVYPEFSSDRVLVMEYLEGTRIDDIAGLQAKGYDLTRIARYGTDALFKMVLLDGLFHADPHPGNVLVLEGGRLAFLDFGVVGRIREELRDAMGTTFIALVRRDYDALARLSISLGFVPETIDQEKYRRAMRVDLERVIEPLVGRKLRHLPPMLYVDNVMALAAKHRLRLPRELFLLGKCLALFESLFRHLAPDLNFFAEARPYARQVVRRALGVMARRVRREAVDLLDVATALPRDLHAALRKFNANTAQFRLQVVGLDPHVRKLDRASNRLTFALIISAIIVGSSILLPSARDTVALQWIVAGGFVVGVLLGLWLVIGIMRSGTV